MPSAEEDPRRMITQYSIADEPGNKQTSTRADMLKSIEALEARSAV